MTTLAELVVKIGLDSAQFEREISGMSGKLRSIGNDMSRIGGQLTRGLTLPIVGAGVASFKMYKDFEFAMQQIVGLVGVSQSQVDQWSKDLVRMGPELGKAPKELAEALYFVTSAGVEASEALDIVEASAKASAAGLGETKVIADLVTSVMNAYGKENYSAAYATDILVAAVREGKAEASELAGALGQVLPIASEMGVSFEQVAAATAAMTRTGTDANTANMQLKNIMMGLLKPTKQAEEALNMMGVSSAELRQQIKDEGLLAVLMRLKDLTNEFGDDVMAQVFPNIRSLIGVLDLMGANLEDNIKIFENVADATGALEKAFAVASETAEFKWQRALASVQALLITVGEAVKTAVIPVIEGFVKNIQKLIEWFQRLTPAAQSNIIKFAAYVAILGPVLLVGGKLIGMFIGIVNSVTVLSRALRLAIGWIKLKAAALIGLKAVMMLMSGPAGWIMLAVAAIAAIGYAWYKASQDSTDALEVMKEKVRTQMMVMFADIKQQVVEHRQAVINEYKAIGEGTTEIFEALSKKQVEIGQAGFEILMENLEAEKEEKLAFLEQQKAEELALVDKALAAELLANEGHALQLKRAIEAKYIGLAEEVVNGYARINEIIAVAVKEERALNQAEVDEIIGIKEEMYKAIIGKLEKYVEENKRIEALKNMDINSMTADQLKEYQKIVDSAHDDMRKSLETDTEEALRILEELYGGSEEHLEEYAEGYNKIMQTVIDKNIEIDKSYEDMSKGVSTALSNLRSEGIGYIADLETESTEHFGRMKDDAIGEAEGLKLGVIDALKMMYNHIVGRSIIPDMVTESLKHFNNLKDEGTRIFDSLKTTILPVLQSFAQTVKNTFLDIKNASVRYVTELYSQAVRQFQNLWNYIRSIPAQAYSWGRNIFLQLWNGMKSIFSSIQSWFYSSVLPLLNRLNPWARSSPSLIDNIRSGLREIEKLYAGIELPEYRAVISPSQVSLLDHRSEANTYKDENPVTKHLFGGSSPPELGGKIAMILADDRVIKQLWRQLRNAERSEGARTTG